MTHHAYPCGPGRPVLDGCMFHKARGSGITASPGGQESIFPAPLMAPTRDWNVGRRVKLTGSPLTEAPWISFDVSASTGLSSLFKATSGTNQAGMLVDANTARKGVKLVILFASNPQTMSLSFGVAPRSVWSWLPAVRTACNHPRGDLKRQATSTSR